MEEKLLEGEQPINFDESVANEVKSKETYLDVHDAEQTTGSSFGKFKDAGSLLSAYNNLEAEFTKKCQRLSALEKNVNDNSQDASKNSEPLTRSVCTDLSSTKNSGEVPSEVIAQALANDDIKSQVLKLYLKDIARNVPPVIIDTVGSTSASAPLESAKNFDEAGKIASSLFI